MLKGVIKMAWYNLLKRMILTENYSTKEEMQEKIDIFAQKGRITETQKADLEKLLNSAN
ncbi:hypothetical protein [Peptostreptococcus russellii]|uniref:hypothetical protein n=1 Tax=Peptostreptococcus russellii TaxID=215200 RepID=UPI002942A2F6|nr:hypothetical protein [Peptostreptococcus russellii]